MWTAIRHVERNPVKARMVRKAENYQWSSAAAHCQKAESDLLTKKSAWKRKLNSIEDWPSWLAEGEDSEALEILCRNTNKGLPCGPEGFIEKLERRAGKLLAFQAIGRPNKQGGG